MINNNNFNNAQFSMKKKFNLSHFIVNKIKLLNRKKSI